MRMSKVTGPPFTCACIRCGTRMQTDREAVSADLDGVPFRAYYCNKCAAIRLAEHGPWAPIVAVEESS